MRINDGAIDWTTPQECETGSFTIDSTDPDTSASVVDTVCSLDYIGIPGESARGSSCLPTV